jgi:hypothetical protein
VRRRAIVRVQIDDYKSDWIFPALEILTATATKADWYIERRALLRQQGPAPGHGRSGSGPGQGHARQATALRIMRRAVRRRCGPTTSRAATAAASGFAGTIGGWHWRGRRRFSATVTLDCAPKLRGTDCKGIRREYEELSGASRPSWPVPTRLPFSSIFTKPTNRCVHDPESACVEECAIVV